MEASHEPPGDVQQVRQSIVRMELPWNSMVLSLKTVVLSAAHKCYTKWYMIKHKHNAMDLFSCKKAKNTNDTPLSLGNSISSVHPAGEEEINQPVMDV